MKEKFEKLSEKKFLMMDIAVCIIISLSESIVGLDF